MNKRTIVYVLAAVLVASVHLAQAQQPGKVYRIGTLENTSPTGSVHLWDVFRHQLRELGYVEGKNIALEHRWARGRRDQLPELAAELVRLKIDVIVTVATSPAVAAKQATSTIPIVTASISDPVGVGLIASLARPGGNVTGLSSINVELGGKRLELLKEAFPKISRVAFLRPPGSVNPQIKEMEIAAQALGLQLQALRVQGPEDFGNAFSAMTKEHADALIVMAAPIYFAKRRRLAEFAVKSRVPGMFPHAEYAEAGGLMAYGILYADLFRRAAIYVDRILKGAKPADLPVEQPTKFEFVINLKTAKQIGVTIPPEVLMRADRVIK